MPADRCLFGYCSSNFNRTEIDFSIAFLWQVNHPSSISDKSIIRCVLTSQSFIVCLIRKSSIVIIWRVNYPLSYDKSIIYRLFWQANNPSSISDESIFHCALTSQSLIVYFWQVNLQSSTWQVNHPLCYDMSIIYCLFLTIKSSIVIIWRVNHPLCSDKSIIHCVLTSQSSSVYFWQVNLPSSFSDKSIFHRLILTSKPYSSLWSDKPVIHCVRTSQSYIVYF